MGQMRLKKLTHSIYHNDAFKALDNMISSGLLTQEQSYEVERTPTLYDPQTFQPTYGYIIICNDTKWRKISKEIIETYFQSIDEWREEQLEKLIPNEPNPMKEQIQEYIILITHQDHFLPLYDKTNKELLIEDIRKNDPSPFGLPLEHTKPNHLYRLIYITKPGTQHIKVEESPTSDYITITSDNKWNQLLNKWDYTSEFPYHLDKVRPQIMTLLKNLPETIKTLRDESIGKIL